MQSFSKRSFRFQMLTLAGILFAVMLVAALFVFFNSVRIIEENRLQDVSLMVSNYEHSLPETAERYYVLLNTLRYSTDMQKAMTQTDPAEYVANAIRIRKELNFYKAACPGVRSIYLNGTVNPIDIRTSGSHDVPEEMRTSNGIRPFFSGAYFVDNYGVRQPVFFLGCPVPSGQNIDGAGTALLEVDGNTLTMDFTHGLEAGAGIYYYFLDKNGEIFFTNVSDERETEQIFSHFDNVKDHEETTNHRLRNYAISVRHLTPFQITLVVALSQRAIVQMALDAFSLTFLIIVVLSTLIFLTVSKTLRSVLQPMEDMMWFMDEVNLSVISDRSARANVDGFEEMQVMATHFNDMLDQISHLNGELMTSMENLYHLEVLNRESELNYLRSQINPHFLYNTLETVRGMAVMEGAPMVQKMVGALIRVFRYNVKKGAAVLLGEEMDMIQSYLLIQTLRFGDRLTVEYEVDDAARQCVLPKMLLQPVVENLVQHGIEESFRDDGLIRIEARVENGILCIDCRDNGRGMSQEELSQAYANIQADSYTAGTGVGLRNVYGRLKLVYGERFRFDITSLEDEGTNMHIELPARGMENGTD